MPTKNKPRSRTATRKKKIAKLSPIRKVLIFVLLFAVLGGIGFLAYTTLARDYSNVEFANIRVGKITPGEGHIGVDIWWNSLGGITNPCHNSNDPFYGACIMSNVGTISYYKVMHFGPDGKVDYPYGIFIDNKNQNQCTTANWCHNKSAKELVHNWGRLVTGASIEIYPYTPNTAGLRAHIEGFPVFANGGRYSADIGDITLPQLGKPNVATLNGFITQGGQKIADKRVTVDAFQNDTTFYSSTGYALHGFTTVSSNQDGYYTLGAVPAGRSYKIYITDNQTNKKIIIDGVSIMRPYERIDFNLDENCFGYRDCQIANPGNSAGNSIK